MRVCGGADDGGRHAPRYPSEVLSLGRPTQLSAAQPAFQDGEFLAVGTRRSDFQHTILPRALELQLVERASDLGAVDNEFHSGWRGFFAK